MDGTSSLVSWIGLLVDETGLWMSNAPIGTELPKYGSSHG